MTNVINLFGSSGTGKSTTRADLFQLMKRGQKSVEEVVEFAKELTWQKRFEDLADQIYVTGEQNRRQRVLLGKVDYIITDSPLLLGAVYAKNDYLPSYKPLLRELFDSYNNINIFLKRVKPFVQAGRNETETESDAIAEKIRKMLTNEKISFVTMDADDKAPDKIFGIIQTLEAFSNFSKGVEMQKPTFPPITYIEEGGYKEQEFLAAKV